MTIDCREPRRVAEFWAAALGWEVTHLADDGAMVEAPGRDQPALEFVVVPEPKTIKNRVHLGLATTDLDEQISRFVALGAELAWEEELPPEWTFRNVVLRDPEGNEFCLGSDSTSA